MTSATAPSEKQAIPVDPFVIVGLAGILFLVVGGTELLTQLFPMSLGSAEWEFGTYSSLMDTLPLFTMGMGFLTVFAIARPHPILAKVLGVLFILLALFLLAGAFLYATNVPQALRIRPRSAAHTGVKKAVAKAAIQIAVYPIAFLWAGVLALKNSGGSRRGGVPLS